MMKYKSKIIGTLVAVLFLAACGSVAVTGRRQILLVSDSEVLTASLTQYDEYIRSATKSTDRVKSAMVERVGRKIAEATESYLKQSGHAGEVENFKWEFNLIKDDNVNAFCMPGGKIVVFEGLLPLISTDDELAVVLGHEVAHAVAKHSNERMSQGILAQYGASIVDATLSQKTEAIRSLGNTVFGLSAQLGVMLPYSRKHESEADYMGLVFMTLAGYDPSQAITFWQKMADASGNSGGSDILKTHPSESKRIADIQRHLPEMEKYKK